MQLQEQAKLSTSKPAFSDHSELLSNWQLQGFDLDIPFMKASQSKAVTQMIIRYGSMILAPIICGVTLYDFYRVQFEHLTPIYPFGSPKQVGMMLKGNQIPNHYTAEMLGIGVVFAGVTILVYMATIRKQPKYFNYAYMLIVAAILGWLMI
jgi:hypothetical protein